MRIGVYVESASNQQPTGIGLHVRSLVEALSALDRENEYFLYYPHHGGKQAGPNLQVNGNFRPRPIRIPKEWQYLHPTLWWKWYFPFCLRRDRLDVYHGPNHFLPAFGRDRCVVTIHDVANCFMPIYGSRRDAALDTWIRFSLGQAAMVIALSNNTRNDVEKLGVEPERIRVIYGGGHVIPEEQIRYDRIDELKRSLNLPERFVLFVGSLQPRKNVPFLIRSFARLRREAGVPHHLVVCGAPGMASAETALVIRELDLEDCVHLTGYVEEWQVPLLYKLAEVFVLPSLYEGFTLVTLEAMAYGVPVIATATSSIAEGVGDAARLVPLGDEAELAKAIQEVLSDATLRSRMIEKGRKRVALFSWERCAQETLRVYREVYEKRCALRAATKAQFVG